MLFKIFRPPVSLPLRLQLHRRHLSSTPEPALQAWIQQMTSALPKTTTDLIDLERAQQLSRVLPTRTGKSQVLPEWGTALGKGHHLAYFWPKNENEQLGEDGSSRASPSSTRRMPSDSLNRTIMPRLRTVAGCGPADRLNGRRQIRQRKSLKDSSSGLAYRSKLAYKRSKRKPAWSLYINLRSTRRWAGGRLCSRRFGCTCFVRASSGMLS